MGSGKGWLPALAAGLGMVAAGAPALAADEAKTAAADTCCAVVELRQYTLHPGKRDVLVGVFEREFVEGQEAHGMHVIGQFRDLDAPDRFVWLRGFAGMPQRAQALQGFYSGPVWQANRETANGTMLDSDNVLLLRPATNDDGFARHSRPLPPRDAVAVPPGLVEVRIFYFDAAPSADTFTLFATGAIPLLSEAGAMPLATLVTAPGVNTFPRLPVREGEHVLAWFAQFPDRPAYDRYAAALSKSPRWRAALDTLTRDAPRAPEVLRLQPTARSRLPH